MEWLPIETCDTAPYEPIDLWVVPAPNKDAKPRREANAYHSGNGKYWISSSGAFIEGRRFYEDGDWCFDPDDRGPDATIVTHWMPLPAPPSLPPNEGGV